MGEDVPRSPQDFAYYRCYGCLDSLPSETELVVHETGCSAMALVNKFKTEIEAMRDNLHTELRATYLREQEYENSIALLEDDLTDLKRIYTRTSRF
jgi:hypothetical protein